MTGASPDDFHHVAAGPHEPLRTFHPRRAALGRDRADALNRLWPRYGLDKPQGLLAPEQVFGRRAPLVFEIGFGNGDHLLSRATNEPQRDFIGAIVHLALAGASIGAFGRGGAGGAAILEPLFDRGDGPAARRLDALGERAARQQRQRRGKAGIVDQPLDVAQLPAGLARPAWALDLAEPGADLAQAIGELM